ncbi:auxin-responsive protein IAA26-like [Olea europaea var. sylvestris]|uniref:Auxin-responsive protein n=1 Tax=Olea europaea subsp. europaea TaxID=158383 RepID=A0A8S0UL63_OLEEU|nr:auxin-responsive protein IAA26-like [Olea europaea var. sylvestris]CAA3016499.1 auxin-responsive IAA26-like [Olea europaea subsp. europaea]
MEGYSRKDVGCPQLLDLIPKEKEWLVKSAEETNYGLSEEKKLELRLGPPGGDWTFKQICGPTNESLLSFGFFPNTTAGATTTAPWQHQTKASFFPLMEKESCRIVELQGAEKKAFSPANTAVPNSSSAQKRTAPAPVVGWPPIRSFRKNLANGNSSKLSPESQKDFSKKPIENCPKNKFVKINMDGVPIGRKVDLKAFHSYEKLSSAVDELFRGLLAAQGDSSTNGIKKEVEGEKVISGLLDGSGEYTLVYEDNEGDRMLVGDVPWDMFVSTVKRLRVLKSSELPMLFCGSKPGKLSLDRSI